MHPYLQTTHSYIICSHSSLPESCIFPFSVVEYCWLESCSSYDSELFVRSGAVQRSILQRCEPATSSILHARMKKEMIFLRFSIFAAERVICSKIAGDRESEAGNFFQVSQ